MMHMNAGEMYILVNVGIDLCADWQMDIGQDQCTDSS